jgi:hypothetical protein
MLTLSVIKHHSILMKGGDEILLHAFLNSAQDGSGQLHIPTAVSPEVTGLEAG